MTAAATPVAAARRDGAIIRPTYIIAASAFALFTLTSAAAGSAARQSGAKSVFSAFSLFSNGKLAHKRCGAYTVTRATYTGRATSPEPRLAGLVTWQGRIVHDSAGAGVATGRLVVREASSRKVRMTGELRGVFSSGRVVSGIVSGTLRRPTALLLANVSLVFGRDLDSANGKLGLEVTTSSAVAYAPLGKCG